MADQTNAEVSDERLRELLPCPFCGGAPSIVGYGPYHITCIGCGARTKTAFVLTGSEAIAAWNRRSVTSQASEGAGWKLVPAEADDRMVYAINEWTDQHPPDPDHGYGDGDTEALYEFIVSLEPRAASPSKRVERLETATHRHVKRGSEYVLIGYGKMQAENWQERVGGGFGSSDPPRAYAVIAPVDMREVAIYRSVADGSLWVRPREEFEDGRFQALQGGRS